MPQVPKHVHKLKKTKFKSGNMMYFCVLDCPFKINPALSLGKKVICWRCGKEFHMNEYSVRLVKPHCMDCHKSKEKLDIIDILPRPESANTGLLDIVAPATASLSERLQKTIDEAKQTSEKDEDL